MSLKDAIDRDEFIIDGENITDDNLQKMTIEDLWLLKIRINKKISMIAALIKEKQTGLNVSGEKEAKDWYVRHRRSLSINQRVMAYVNILIKKRARAERSLGDYFKDRAKVILPRELFETILNQAKIVKRREERYAKI